MYLHEIPILAQVCSAGNVSQAYFALIIEVIMVKYFSKLISHACKTIFGDMFVWNSTTCLGFEI